jgi:ribosome maturation factor RimP
LEEIAAGLGYELVELSSVRLGGHTVIRIFIHKPGGVNIRDCAIVSRAYADYLDLENVIPGKYRLEVSSLGLDRPLKQPADYKRRTGENVKLELTPGTYTKNVVTGALIDADDTGITLDIDNNHEHFTYDQIIRGKIVY